MLRRPADPSQSHSVLADTLSTRYKQTGDLANLDDAITLATTSLDLSFAADLMRRVEAMNHSPGSTPCATCAPATRANLDRAVEAVDSHLAMLWQGDHARPAALSNLTALLTRRFHESQNTADLDRAIQAAEEAANT